MEEDDDDNDDYRPNLEYVPNPHLESKSQDLKIGSDIIPDPLQYVVRDYNGSLRYACYID